ncbi:hypothetical protein [Filimonas effusa]|uniref:Uncharacterized protein n=1 Tax=Filimonas effusa TaxID=2508721 RepID=A0A4Q1D3R8_9BACT|nr:hypothetical protein [Filimonas effusa]RXK83082.1 hypothetical protein ESB13_13235 [Filimonas effusa]
MKQSTTGVYGFLSLAVLLFAWGCRSARGDQGDALQPTQWQQAPIVIDGNDSDWVKPLRYYAQKEKLAYNITSDSNNVYVQMTTKDEETQEKIIKGGMTVWFNSHAEMSEERAAGISFPTGAEGLRRNGAPISGRAAGANSNTSLPGLESYRLFGFSSTTAIDNYNAGQVSEEGVEVNLNFNAAGDLVYEAKVPLKVLYPKVTSGVYANRNLAVGFYIDGLLPQPGQRGSGGGGGGGISIGGGFGMGGFGGSGMGVSIGSGSLGRIGGGGGGRKAKQTRVWQTVYLAKAPRG